MPYVPRIDERGAPAGGYSAEFTDTQARRHWHTQLSFVRSLMLGSSWEGLHAILVSSASPQLERMRSIIGSTWPLASSHLHAVSINKSADDVILARCGRPVTEGFQNSTCETLQNGQCPTAILSTLRSFYGQWEKAAVCFKHVQTIESEREQHFRFVIKMRPDWAFRRGPPLSALVDTSLVYARYRCAETSPVFLPPAYLSLTVHRDHDVIYRKQCPPGTLMYDDQLLIAPRKHAEALFGATRLRCPVSDKKVRSHVLHDCKSMWVQECFLTVYLQHFVRWPVYVGPIPIFWGAWQYADEYGLGWSGYSSQK